MKRRGDEACRWNNPGISEIPGLFHNAGVAVGAGLDAPRNVPPTLRPRYEACPLGACWVSGFLAACPGRAAPAEPATRTRTNLCLDVDWRNFGDLEVLRTSSALLDCSGFVPCGFFFAALLFAFDGPCWAPKMFWGNL